MNVRVFDGVMPTSQSFVERVLMELRSAFAGRESRIGDVEVRIADTNAQRGGVDKECRILAYIHGHGPVTVSHRAQEFYAAAHGAIGKLKRAVAHRFVRR